MYEGHSVSRAQFYMEFILQIARATDNELWVRVPPQSDELIDLSTHQRSARGIVRFTFTGKSGPMRSCGVLDRTIEKHYWVSEDYPIYELGVSNGT
jgi:hypothetical protein